MGYANIVFSISDTGGGHRSAAVALDAALQELSGNTVTCNIVDILHATGFPLLQNSAQLYDDLSTRLLPIYDMGFWLTNAMLPVELLSRMVDTFAHSHILYTLQALQPHLVVVTHPLTHRFVCWVRQRYRLPFRIATVVTDLVSLHYSWLCKDVDLCMVPTDEAYELLQRRGMPTDLMVRTGFPVHPKFSHYQRSTNESRRDLSLDEQRFTILLTGGGVGSGHVQELVPAMEHALPDCQLLVVTGKNQVLYDELQDRKHSQHTHIYGFVDNMEALMAASDVVVTKAGPGTLMEALVMRCPVIITEAVGKQEQGNIDFVVNRELGFFRPHADGIIDAIQRLTNPNHHAATVENLADAVPCDGSMQIAQLLLDQLASLRLPPIAEDLPSQPAQAMHNS
jgi:UDP-N-acetylglucosamine:LPS N-acetylglucosamine transferase